MNPYVTRVRDPFQLGSAQRGQLVTAQGIPINQTVLWSTKSRKEQVRRWQQGEVTSVPRVWRSPFAEGVESIPVVDQLSPRLIKYGALILATRRRRPEGARWIFTYMQIRILKHRYQTALQPRERWRYFQLTMENVTPRRYCVRGSQWIIENNR